jgi:hypothetical protein
MRQLALDNRHDLTIVEPGLETSHISTRQPLLQSHLPLACAPYVFVSSGGYEDISGTFSVSRRTRLCRPDTRGFVATC